MAFAEQPTKEAHRWTIEIGLLVAMLLGIVGVVVWLIARANLPVSNTDISDAGRESVCVKRGLEYWIERDEPVTNRRLIAIRSYCSEAEKREIAEKDKELAVNRQRSALASIK